MKTAQIKRSSLFLMANLGSEVSRLLSFKEKGDKILMRQTLERAEQIITELREFPEMEGRIAELDTLLEVIQDIAQPKSVFQISPEHIKSYFYPFAFRLVQKGM